MVEERLVERVETVVTVHSWLVGQVVSTYVPSCKVPTEWPPKIVDSEVLACFVSAGQLNSYRSTPSREEW